MFLFAGSEPTSKKSISETFSQFLQHFCPVLSQQRSFPGHFPRLFPDKSLGLFQYHPQLPKIEMTCILPPLAALGQRNRNRCPTRKKSPERMSSENGAKSAHHSIVHYLAEHRKVSGSISSSRPSNFVQVHAGSRTRFKRTSVEAPNDVPLRESLVQMIRRLTPNPTLREDLLQEAMIHLWRTETRRPGQTRSWYLQSCRFHLQHYLNGGRSIDSTKRWRDQLPFTEHSEDIPQPGEQADSGNSIFTCISAREIMSLLTPHLSPQEREVLVCLAEGLGAREIGRKLNLSHTMAIRHRRKIAILFKRLGLQSSENPEVIHSNGSHPGNGHGKLRKKRPLPHAK